MRRDYAEAQDSYTQAQNIYSAKAKADAYAAAVEQQCTNENTYESTYMESTEFANLC